MAHSAVLFNCIIFNIIKKYLLHDMLICLADTCTSLRQYKFENIMILNDNASLSYYNDNLFRQTFLDYRKKVIAKYPQFKFGLNLRQLYLGCSNTLHDIFEDVYYVDFTDVKTLRDITALKGIPIVKLLNCTNLKNIGILSHIGHKKNLSTYKVNKHLLELDWYNNTEDDYININSFISLVSCTAITDFSSLRNIKHIDLDRCTQITSSDLIHFSNTRTLKLVGCYLITDVSMLSHLDGLDISECYNITDVCPLSKLHTLYARFCRSITNVSALGNLKNLDLTSCYNIYDVSALGKVKKLNLSFCYKIYDVSALINVKFLNIEGCAQITDIPYLQSKKLNLSQCFGIKDFSKVINVKELSLRHCKQLTNKNLPCFVNINFLDLFACRNITNVDILLDNVKVLDLSYCTGIRDCSSFADDGITTLDRNYIRKLK